jgi:hypothetical protein
VKSPPKMQNDNRSNEDQGELQGDQRRQVLPRGSPPARRPHGALGAGVCGQQVPPNEHRPDSRSRIRPPHRRQRRRRTEPLGRRSRLPRPVRSRRGGAWRAHGHPAQAPPLLCLPLREIRAMIKVSLKLTLGVDHPLGRPLTLGRPCEFAQPIYRVVN